MARKKCVEPDCTKGAEGKTGRCIAHGGGRRCVEPNCMSSARDNTGRCVAHGGGRRGNSL